ncbi:MAG TPA: 5-oxoprolinase subunit PxpB [Mycobacteriales bacterium]|nr:5-oxoprolinase subunit PxpB [Mycobacteriales bacterium]
MRLRLAGDSALLVEVSDTVEAHRVRAALECARAEGRVPGLRETVAGQRSVLALVDPLACDPARVERVAASGVAGTAPAAEPRTVHIPVVYDGADLDWVAEHRGLAVDEVVRRHGAAVYTVAFLGFSPGFGYLSGVDPALHVPRRDSPREKVPAGSVAIAGDLTAVYPQATPGGWRLLGHTELAVFDPKRTPPGLFEPGDLVRFTPV